MLIEVHMFLRSEIVEDCDHRKANSLAGLWSTVLSHGFSGHHWDLCCVNSVL